MRHLFTIVAVAMGISTPAAALAQDANGHTVHHVAQAASAPVTFAEGEVRRVDKGAGTIMLKHGPIENLKMSPMTMVFRAKDPAMLDQVRAGDKVKFAAEDIGGQLTVTRIERLR